ncbi:NTP transferase domain-containing protein [candidate division GN15 bacterium]|nr:NTP transferase domain-containing protein [candidate division GN15 bacterium]
MSAVIYGVILAGGKGERFWPLSRIDKPKQFLRLTSEKTMLEETIDRVKPLIPHENVRIVSGESMSQHIRDSLKGYGEVKVLTEPRARNTCLAIGLAAAHLVKENPEAVMAVLSADHLIRPPEKLLRILEDAVAIASKDSRIVTIGITPTRPETGYGYIKLGNPIAFHGDSSVFEVSAFAEKPKAVVAQEYYYSRKYLWNSGMFVWRAQTILDSIRSCQAELAELIDEYSESIGTEHERTARTELYNKSISISIDYAVLENAENVAVIKADIVWDDVGSWGSLQRYKQQDADNNVMIGDVISLETYETTVYNDAEGIIATLGMSDAVVVRSGDITLVAHKTKLDKIKDLLAQLKEDESYHKYL